jgi:hypothetical protein
MRLEWRFQRLRSVLMRRSRFQWRVGEWVVELDTAGELLDLARITAIEWRLLRLGNGRFYRHDGHTPWRSGDRTRAPRRIIPVTEVENWRG